MCPVLPSWGVVAVLAWVWVLGHGNPLAALAAHLAIAWSTFHCWRMMKRGHHAAMRAGLLALALPGFGALAAWLIARRPARRPPMEGPLEPPGVPFLGLVDQAPLPGRGRGLEELELDLHAGPLDAKLAATRALKAIEGGEGVAVLRRALGSPDHQVALLASLAIAELETDFEEALRTAREKLASTPDSEARLTVANILRRYVASDLPAAPAAVALLREAAELATEASRPEGAPPSAWRELAIARLRLGDPEGALDASQRAIAAQDVDVEALLVHLEALWTLGQIDALVEAARAALPQVPCGTPAYDVVLHWSNPHDLAAPL